MTDEDSDDERMERADRIRRMREGRRSQGRTDGAGEAETVDDETDDDAADAESTAETVDEAGQAETADDGADDTTAVSATVDGTTDPEPAGEADEAAAETPDAATTDEKGKTESADEPTTDETTNGTDRPDDAGGFEFERSSDDGHDGDGTAENGSDDLAVEAESLADAAADLAQTQRGVAESVSAGDAESAVTGLGGDATFAIPDQATTVSEDDDALDAEGTVAAARAAAATGRRTATARDRTRVLEFELGDERFCLDIDYIEEIVELENMTRVPNSPSYVEGVVDLRGQVTAIINPKDALDVSDEGRGDLIVVFDSEQVEEQGHLGWVVDEVRQVTPVSEEEVNESPDEDAEHINGVINREDEDDFVVWTTPELALNS